MSSAFLMPPGKELVRIRDGVTRKELLYFPKYSFMQLAARLFFALFVDDYKILTFDLSAVFERPTQPSGEEKKVSTHCIKKSVNLHLSAQFISQLTTTSLSSYSSLLSSCLSALLCISQWPQFHPPPSSFTTFWHPSDFSVQ